MNNVGADIVNLMEQYFQWVKDKTVLTQIDKNCVQVTTPFLDRHNDCLQFYIRKEEADGFLLSDDGYVIQDFVSSGCSLDNEKEKLLQITLANFGVQLDGQTLVLKASADNFAIKKHNLLQVMLVLSNLLSR